MISRQLPQNAAGNVVVGIGTSFSEKILYTMQNHKKLSAQILLKLLLCKRKISLGAFAAMCLLLGLHSLQIYCLCWTCPWLRICRQNRFSRDSSEYFFLRFAYNKVYDKNLHVFLSYIGIPPLISLGRGGILFWRKHPYFHQGQAPHQQKSLNPSVKGTVVYRQRRVSFCSTKTDLFAHKIIFYVFA